MYICTVGFKLIICLLPERSTNAILVQTLAEKWWDTTCTFHIIDREMIVTPHDFHCMTNLRCDRALINLEGKLGTQLGIDLLRRTPLRGSAISTLRQIIGLSHR